MPKKTKDSNDKIEIIKNLLTPKKSSKSTNIDKKKSKESNSILPPKVSEKKNTTKAKTSNKKSETSSKGKTTITTSKKSTSKAVSSKSTKKSNTTAKSKSSKTVSSNSSISKKSTRSTAYSPEYYDLPYRYNKTVVKILAQTPTNLFVYWEISDEDRSNLKKTYGEYFFEITKPVLVIHNTTMNYSFEVTINDFANSWYLQVNDSDCDYKIELGRRPIPINYNYIPQYDREKNGPLKPIEISYIPISSSNELKAPNDHILFNNQNKIHFRNVKTNKQIEKDLKEFPFIYKDNTFVSLYKLYQYLYKDEILMNHVDFTNPSSGNPSSSSFSSKFK